MNQIEKAKQAVGEVKQMGIVDMIQNSVKELGKALPAHMRPERIVRIALTTLRLNPELYKCTPQSFMGALFTSAQLGLEPNVEGQAYIIPYTNSKKINGQWVKIKEAQFQIGYKGYVELFFRHQSALSLDMQVVHENDDFDFAYGTESFIKHKPSMKNRGEVIAYYAVAKLKDGASLFKVMSKEDCLTHGKKHSKSFDYDSSPWQTDPDSMSLKTVLIQLMKLLPKSIEIQKALAMDETVKTEIKADMFEVKDQVDWTQTEPEQIENKEPEQAKEQGSEMITTPQKKKIEAMIAEAVKAGASPDLRKNAHVWMEVKSFNDLTKKQGISLIEKLEITIAEIKGGSK